MSDEVESKEELTHFTDGYFKYTDVSFHWYLNLHPWHANAVKALINPVSLTDPNHPLREPGSEGFKMTVGTQKDGKRRMLFTLRQVEYVQYYIHEMQLTDPRWVVHLCVEPSDREGEEYERILDSLPIDIPEWVPMPNTLLQADQLSDIEEIFISSPEDLKSRVKQYSRHNTKPRDPSTLTPEERSAQKALTENLTPGPGMGNSRKSRQRQKQRAEKLKDKEEKKDEVGEGGAGWGGFSLGKDKGSNGDIPADPAVEKISPPSQLSEKSGERPAAQQEALSKPSEPASSNIPSTISPSSVTEPEMTSTQEPAPITMVPNPPSPLSEPQTVSKKVTVEDVQDEAEDIVQPSAEMVKEVEEFTRKFSAYQAATNYFFHASQAVILASQGGLAAVIKPEDLGEKGKPPPKEIGRSLFLALDVTTWEEDEEVVLEVGWSAIWWQEDIEAKESVCEEMRDGGHWIVQDHRLSHKNGKVKKDHRGDYKFGHSIPVTLEDLDSTIERKMVDLHLKAGGGPTYIVLHSTDCDAFEIAKTEVDTTSWSPEFQPEGWSFPSYAHTAGVGEIFIIDTAIMFTAVEPVKPVENNVIPRSEKTLAEVCEMLFGGEEELVVNGNAGNDAFYNIELLMALATGPSIDELREQYLLTQLASESPDLLVPISDESVPADAENTKHPESSQQVHEIPKVAEEEAEANEDYDSEDDMIGGVYAEDDEGNLVPI